MARPVDATRTATDVGPAVKSAGGRAAGDMRFNDRRGIIGPYRPGTVSSPRGYVYREPDNWYPNQDRVQAIHRGRLVAISGRTVVNSCTALTSDPFDREAAMLLNTYVWPLFVEKIVATRGIRMTPTSLTTTGSMSNYLHTGIAATLLLENLYAGIFLTGYNEACAELVPWIGKKKTDMERTARALSAIPMPVGLVERYRPWFTPLLRSKGGPVLFDWPNAAAMVTLGTSGTTMSLTSIRVDDTAEFPWASEAKFDSQLTNVKTMIELLMSRDTATTNANADFAAIREFGYWLGWKNIQVVLSPPKVDDLMFEKRLKYGALFTKDDQSVGSDSYVDWPTISTYDSTFLHVGPGKPMSSDFNGIGPALAVYNPTPTDLKVIAYGDVVPSSWHGDDSTYITARYDACIGYTKEDGWFTQKSFFDQEAEAAIWGWVSANILGRHVHAGVPGNILADHRVDLLPHGFIFKMQFDMMADEHLAELSKLLDVPQL